jgi:hypothetical protein
MVSSGQNFVKPFWNRFAPTQAVNQTAKGGADRDRACRRPGQPLVEVELAHHLHGDVGGARVLRIES